METRHALHDWIAEVRHHLCELCSGVGGGLTHSENDGPFERKEEVKKMYDKKSGYEQQPKHGQRRTATLRQIDLFKGLTKELGSPASESQVMSFESLSVGEASDKLTALIEQRKRGEISEEDPE